MRYGDGDGALLIGLNYCWVIDGPIGYNGDRDWLKALPVLDNELLPLFDWYDVL